jgi:broad specificity phosphatase PhoE
MRIYFRHGEKEYANGHNKIYKFDTPLKDTAHTDIEAYALYLIAEYGAPSAIICSPYLRTRQTAEIMNSCLEERVQIYCDPLLSEYLGHHRDQPLDVYPETEIFKPPHPETWKDLERRSIEHYESFSHYDEAEDVFWFITHGTVISCITKHLGKMYKNPPILGGICIGTVPNPSCLTQNLKRFYTIIRSRTTPHTENEPPQRKKFVSNEKPASKQRRRA